MKTNDKLKKSGNQPQINHRNLSLFLSLHSRLNYISLSFHVFALGHEANNHRGCMGTAGIAQYSHEEGSGRCCHRYRCDVEPSRARNITKICKTLLKYILNQHFQKNTTQMNNSKKLCFRRSLWGHSFNFSYSLELTSTFSKSQCL